MDITTKTPCAQCPFLRTSTRGWLGPWTVEDLLFSLGRERFPCHMTITGRQQRWDDPKLKGCAGAAIFLNNKSELSRHPDTREHQNNVRHVPDEVKQKVFANGNEFREHHKAAAQRKHGEP